MKPHRTTLEPGLDVTIHTHDVVVGSGALPAWTLVTSGLEAFRQREVVLTIVRPSSAPSTFPDGVLGYIPALKEFAMQGRIVGAGGVSGYRAPGPFRLGAFVGLAYVDARPIPGIAFPDAALAGIFLTEGELAMATSCSPRRVLNRLGKGARYFPTPYWSAPSRESVYAVDDAGKSLLAKFERATVAKGSATLRGNVMHLSLPDAFASVLAGRIESRAASAILPGCESGVSAALVWSPGQQEPEAIFADSADPSAFAATFVALVPNDADQDDVRFMEDGYVVMLSAASADRLVASMRSGAPLELRGGDQDRTLRVTVAKTN